MKRTLVGWPLALFGLLAPAPAAADDRQNRELAPVRHGKWAASVGGVYRSLAGLPTYGGELSLGADASPKKVMARIEGRYAYAQSPHGLPFHSVHFGAWIGPVFGPLRLGIGGGFGFDVVGRRTFDPPLTRVTLALTAVAAVDVVDLGSSWIFVGVRGDLDMPNIVWLMTRGAIVPGVSAFAGVRF